MIDKKIHIVSLDVPFPANYGGVVDIFYRIIALHKLGYKITLHCFEYGRGEAPILNDYCENVYYYKRKKNPLDLFSKLPFIVKSRTNKTLLTRLLADSAPILFEGIHTCYYLNDERLKSRTKIVRAHNIEQDYYNGLAEKNRGWKKWFFKLEAKKLERYESILQHANSILTVQDFDQQHFEKLCKASYLLPSSINLPAISTESTQDYVLYHGNLSVIENERAAVWLAENVFNQLDEVDVVIAGKDPSDTLKTLCANHGIRLEQNPDNDKMDLLIQRARVHVLYTDQPTGLKLKLLNVLMSKGKIVLNPHMTAGTPFGEFSTVCSTPKQFIDATINAIQSPLSQEKFEERTAWVKENLDVRKNCEIFEKIIDIKTT